LAEKTNLHPRNPHRKSYNFQELGEVNPTLLPFVHTNRTSAIIATKSAA